MRNNKLRTSLTGFAVAWGIFMLIVLLCMSRGVFNSFDHNSQERGSNSITLWGGYTSKPYMGYKENRRIKLRESDIDELVDDLSDNIEAASARVSIDTAVISTPRDYISGGIAGVYPGVRKSSGLRIVAGRFINDNDLAQRRKVMVLSRDNAAILFDDPDKAVGSIVKCLDLAFTVVGLYDNEGRTTSYAPFSTVEFLNGHTGYVGEIRLDVRDLRGLEDGQRLEDDVRSTLARIHIFDSSDQSAVWVWNQFVDHLTMGGALNILNIAIWVIGLFTMLSGIVGVSNIMFVSVRERTHEIGIRRAIGAKPRNILVQIILESVVITSLFGYIGIFMGIGVSEILARLFENSDFLRNPTVDISIAVYVTCVLIAAGALAGLFPAMKALKVKPVEALRDE
ncbi:MAG: ABC transporter permease [Muribaculaceae bacterium]|nr:ABC transporter permease [Muribaculaceae bacterium]